METTSSVIIRVRETTRGIPGIATVLWSVVIAASIFGIRADLARSFFEVVAIVSTFLLAAYLGWHRSLGVIFVAPLISWMFAWFPLIVAEMIRDGLIKGLFVGLFLATIGWMAIGAAEFVALIAMSFPFRVVSAMVHHEPDVIIEGPISYN